MPTKAASKSSAKPPKKPAAKPAAKKPSAPRTDGKKPDAKKPEAKKPELKKPAPKKPELKKPDAKKPELKKPVGQATAPKATDAKKPEAKKPEVKKPEVKKPEPKKPEAKKPELKKPDAKAPAKVPGKPEGPAGPKKPGGEGASESAAPKPKKTKPPVVPVLPPGIGRLMDPSNPVRKPLIPSGPKAAHVKPLGMQGAEGGAAPTFEAKSPFNAEQLDEFKQLLLRKREMLFKDIVSMESQALKGGSGNLSNMPSHIAEQGSEAYDQALSLDLAAADRKLLKEIQDALKRIDAGTYGICEMTGKPIKIERLRELPWARYSIEAARELERQSMRAY